MLQLLVSLWHALLDIARVGRDVVLRRKSGRYRASALIQAPVDAVWELVMRRDVTFVATGTRLRVEPLAGHDDVLLVSMSQGTREVPTIAYRYEAVEPPRRVVVRYLPALSPRAHGIGTDDTVKISLAPEAAATRLTYEREIQLPRLATRISAPLGLRSAVYLVTTQSEHEAGRTAPRASLVQQLVWAVLAFLSFAWLLDWRLALALMGIIAVHEAGHAAAMWWFGLGVSLVSFVPFLGGVAAPNRYYETEWQRGMVALAGVAVSLPVTLALIWWAEVGTHPNLAAIAILAAIINGMNLIPFPALDGSIVASLLLRRVHPSLNQALAIVMFGLFVGLGILLKSPLVWAAIALSFVSVVHVMSLKLDDHLAPMRWPGVVTMLGLYVGLIAVYVFAFHWATATTGRAEARLIQACLATYARDATRLRTCLDEHRIWLLPTR